MLTNRLLRRAGVVRKHVLPRRGGHSGPSPYTEHIKMFPLEANVDWTKTFGFNPAWLVHSMTFATLLHAFMSIDKVAEAHNHYEKEMLERYPELADIDMIAPEKSS